MSSANGSFGVRLESLQTYHFRNLASAKVFFSPSTNLIQGNNGQGKTNLLEAIYCLGYGRSFRTVKLRECVRHGEQSCSVRGQVRHTGVNRDVQVSVSAVQKQLLISEKTVPIADFLGNLHVLAFTNDHLKIVRGGPSERRNFINRAMVSLSPGYVRRLATYGRALRQRNALLATIRDNRSTGERTVLESWEEKLIQDGARIIENRREYVEGLKQVLPQEVFGEKLDVEYVSNVSFAGPSAQEIESEFRVGLERTRQRDSRFGFTSVGPHRDDLKLRIQTRPVSTFGSSGQQRSALLSLYFAQMEVHLGRHGFYPIFLIDDVEAELDATRFRSFLHYLADRTQVFLATAKRTLLQEISPAFHQELQRFEIDQGEISTRAR